MTRLVGAQRAPLEHFELRVYGTPKAQGSKTPMRQRGTGKLIVLEGKTQKARNEFHAWRNDVKAAGLQLLASAGWPPPMDGPIEVGLVFYLPRSGHPLRERFADTALDLDKLTRAVLDGLGPPAGKDGQGGGAGVFINDSRVVQFSRLKKLLCYRDERPGVLITARLIDHLEADDAG